MIRPGSTSKLFTWTAVMQLVEQGKIDLDRDVNDYLDFRVSPTSAKRITMRDLMNDPMTTPYTAEILAPSLKDADALGEGVGSAAAGAYSSQPDCSPRRVL